MQRKWETGERLSTQEASVNLTRLQGEIDTGKMQVQQMLNLNTLEKQQAHDRIMLDVTNQYQVARDQGQMNHDQAMEAMKADIASRLASQGFGQDQALQAAEIQANAVQKDQDRQMATLESQAELAYKYRSLAEQSNISQQDIELRRTTANQQLNLGLQQLGLDEKRINATINSDQFKDRLGAISTFAELGGDNPDVADAAVTKIIQLLGDPTLPGGALLSPEEVKKALAQKTAANAAADAAAKADGGRTDSNGNSLVDGAKALGSGAKNIAEDFFSNPFKAGGKLNPVNWVKWG